MMASRLLLMSAMFTSSLAFSSIIPLVAWSSHRSSALDLLSSTLHQSSSSNCPLQNIIRDDGLCDNDVIVLVDQPGLRTSDLRALSPSTSLTWSLDSAASSIQLPYARCDSASPLSEVAIKISERCGSSIVTVTTGIPAQGDPSVTIGSKYVVHVVMPALEHSFSLKRSATFEQNHNDLFGYLNTLISIFPQHLVILAPSSQRRQEDRTPATSFSGGRHLLGPDFVVPNSTLPSGGVLKRYQLLTPALISTLLVAFFLLVPMVMFGIRALSSIQAPLRLEPPKRFSAQEKKSQ